ncbi:unnamed protein product [Meganyctiphanes norvegica]|uniref:Uncharacterized protein n=1 Tax=Meganyctiphanes norvegica TaxID=48144 RepID=A0AAV2RVQ9_MEGNR
MGRTVGPKENLSFKEKLALESAKKQDLPKVTPSKKIGPKESELQTTNLRPKYIESALFREQFTTTTTTSMPVVSEINSVPSVVPRALGGMIAEEENDSADRFTGFHLGFRPSFPGWDLLPGESKVEPEAEEPIVESDDSVSRYAGFHLGFRPSFPGWDLIPSVSVSASTNNSSTASTPESAPSSHSTTTIDVPEDSSFDYEAHIVRPSDISSFAGELDAFGGDKSASEYTSAFRPFNF